MIEQLTHQGLTLAMILRATYYAENIYWVYGIVMDDSLGVDAEEMIRSLGVSGVETRQFLIPCISSRYYKKRLFRNEKFPVAGNLSQKGFYLPSGMKLSVEQIGSIAEIFIRILS
jgi:perosamine synthetase